MPLNPYLALVNETKVMQFRVVRSLVILAVFVLSGILPAIAGEGMWIPLLLKLLNESEMKSMGMKMSAEDIYSVNKGSLKDAVVHFGGFCTGEVISDQGLVLTNHHCGYDAIQNHSTLEKNYLRDGYWAQSHAGELPNPGLFVTFIVRIEDATKDMLEGITEGMDPKARQARLEANQAAVTASTKREAWQDVMVRSFFEGNQYYLFVTETYNDIRYVGSPPESIGKFGADTDNWVWPRHTGDFSLFRIYAGPDNRPADYSPDNKPYKPRHFFPVSLDGVANGDFTLVFGFPGRTQQYLPSFAVDQVIRQVDPARIAVRDLSLGIMDKHMRADEGTRLALASKYASISNAWKKWIGELQGLKAKHAVDHKRKQEAEFTLALQKDRDLQARYGSLLPSLEVLYRDMDPVIRDRTILAELLGGSNVELFRAAAYADRLARAFGDNGQSGFASLSQRYAPVLESFYKEYQPTVDQEVLAALLKHTRDQLAVENMPASLAGTTGQDDAIQARTARIYRESNLVSLDRMQASLGGEGAAFVAALQDDPGYQLYLDLKKPLDATLNPAYTTLNNQINDGLQQYVTALMAVYPNKRFWPDANSTLRVSYGQVEPYAPRDGVLYETQTYLDGVMEKYVPGDYEFDVPPRLRELYANKDFGDYGENGRMPVCFIASNHTTGGNSGSPAIDAHGNLIGINFDRVWEGTMSDLYYDRSICRNIMVDARYILFVIDKFAGAGHLVREMKLVHPKRKKH